MARVELRLAPIPFDLRRRCALLGLTNPPERVRKHLGDDGRCAVAELAELLYAGATLGMVLRRDQVAPAVGRLNTSLSRGPWSDLWTMPDAPADDPNFYWTPRRGRDALGLDVPAAWGVALLADCFLGRTVGLAEAKGRLRELKAARRALDAADHLLQLLHRVTGWGRAQAESVSNATIDAAWRQLDIAMNAPFAPHIDWMLRVDAATQRATRFRIINGGPELPDAG